MPNSVQHTKMQGSTKKNNLIVTSENISVILEKY